jgi:hypothetical protein
MPYTVPETGEVVWLFGFQCSYPPSIVETKPPPKLRLFVGETPPSTLPRQPLYWAAEGRYFIRHATGKQISYEMAEITDPSKPTLVAVRTIAVSPFPEDRGRAFYFGGFDINYIASHNTGWIYRAELRSR